jgi:putative iron-regulated protein
MSIVALPVRVQTMKSSSSILYRALPALLVVACGSDDEGSPSLPTSTTADAVETYSRIVYASYNDSLGMAEQLEAAAAALVATPTAAAQEDAQDAWLAAREPYLQTEVYRFYGGPIDDDDGPEGLLNAWPLDENHIDYVMGDPDSGIVNNPDMTIDPDTLLDANESPMDGGSPDKAIATGYHAIEFLLWGQDMPGNDGPGDRPYTDYMTTGGTNQNQDRRGQYLTTASELLLQHLQSLVAEWAPDENNYRADFEAEPPADALIKIMSGMIILTGFETGDERLIAALDAQDQEEEHSCFSDNTHRDMVQDVRGVQNVWLGEYDPLDGPAFSGTGVRDVIAAGDAGLADRITARIAESLDLAEALVPPFDKEIAPGNAEGNARVQALADSLFAQRMLLDEAFELYGLTRIPDPE